MLKPNAARTAQNIGKMLFYKRVYCMIWIWHALTSKHFQMLKSLHSRVHFWFLRYSQLVLKWFIKKLFLGQKKAIFNIKSWMVWLSLYTRGSTAGFRAKVKILKSLSIKLIPSLGRENWYLNLQIAFSILIPQFKLNRSGKSQTTQDGGIN